MAVKNTIKMLAVNAYKYRARGLFCASILTLTGCGGMQTSGRASVYDFGPGVRTAQTAQTVPAPILVLADLEATAALDTTALLYRLDYSDAQQLRPYAQARWSMPPAQLLRQRLRETLGQTRTVVGPSEGVGAGSIGLVLRVVLEEFSQVFESPTQSQGLLRFRATLSQPVAVPGRGGQENLLAQRSFVVQRASATADAPGGVRALTAATDDAMAELEQWLAAYRK